MTYVDAALRRLITNRAGNCCEYCLLHREDSPFSFHFEHVIAEKHGGATEADNLCLSCPECNAFKGSDIGSIDPETKRLTPLFNPRILQWADHFRLNEAKIEPITPEGRVTVFLLRLNSFERIAERTLLIRLKHYPCHDRTT
jgi:hypothetical protein